VASTQPRRLYRSHRDKMIAGVCGGVAEYLNVDPTLVRLGFVVLALINGAGILLYLVMAIVVPMAPLGIAPAAGPPIQLDLSWLGVAIPLLIGLGLVLFGAAWAFGEIGPWFWASWSLWNIVRTVGGFFWAALIMAVGLIIILAALRRK